MLKALLAVPLLLVSGCATIINGTSQSVTVSTSPPNASCAVDRMGERIGVVPQTPGSLRVDKSKNSLTVTCAKPGYQTASVTRPPSFSLVTLGNAIAGGLIGVGVDFATGANFKYPEEVQMGLQADARSGYPAVSSQIPLAGRGAQSYYVPDPGQYDARLSQVFDPIRAHAASY